jgi:hypothetical protein
MMNPSDTETLTEWVETSFWTCPLDGDTVNILEIYWHLNTHGYFLMDLPKDRIPTDFGQQIAARG